MVFNSEPTWHTIASPPSLRVTSARRNYFLCVRCWQRYWPAAVYAHNLRRIAIRHNGGEHAQRRSHWYVVVRIAFAVLHRRFCPTFETAFVCVTLDSSNITTSSHGLHGSGPMP
jgi:hypothetical protein